MQDTVAAGSQATEGQQEEALRVPRHYGSSKLSSAASRTSSRGKRAELVDGVGLRADGVGESGRERGGERGGQRGGESWGDSVATPDSCNALENSLRVGDRFQEVLRKATAERDAARAKTRELESKVSTLEAGQAHVVGWGKVKRLPVVAIG